MIHSMVAHLDAVTSLAVDPNGIYLMSGSKGLFFTFYMFLYKLRILMHYISDKYNLLFFLSFFPKQAMIVPLGCGIWTARHVCKK